MDTLVITQLDKFERALDALVESISTSNPSLTAAEQLVVANDGVSNIVKQLALHQSLYARIQPLRAEAEALDNQIRNRIRVLVDCRNDLVSIPAATVPFDSCQVSADEILRMGNRISKFTTPPAIHLSASHGMEPVDISRQTASGAGGTPANIHSDQVSQVGAAEASDIYATLPTESRTYLQQRDKHLREVWKSHPSDNVVRSGLLMNIQQMLDRGLDPLNLTSEQRDAEGQRLAEEEEKQRQKEADEENKRRESVKASGQQREALPLHSHTHEDSGFDLFDPDED